MGQALRRKLGPARASLAALLLAASAEAGAQAGTLTEPIDLGIEAAPPGKFTLVDRRPAADRASRQEDVFNMVVVTVGDELLRPPPPEALRASLQRRLAQWLDGREIVFDTLRVEVEMQEVTVDFRPTAVQGGGLLGNLLGNLIAKGIVEGAARGRTDNMFRFTATGSISGQRFRAELARRYRGSAFGRDFVEAFSAGVDETVDAVWRQVNPAVDVPEPEPASPARRP